MKVSPNFHNYLVDSYMTEGHKKPAQIAETHAKCGKKNFDHVDILLKS